MKFIKFLAVAALTALPGVAQAQWYMGADAGVNFLQDGDLKSDAFNNDMKVGNDTGYAVQMHGGYGFKASSFGTPRLEGELAYRSSGLKSLTDFDGKLSGHTSSLSLMANGVYQFLPKSKWHPFVGVGIGMSRIGVDWQSPNGKLVDDTDIVFAYQGFAGVSYDIAKNWELSAQYRYFGTQDPEFKDTDSDKVKGEYSSHAILAGFTYKFRK